MNENDLINIESKVNEVIPQHVIICQIMLILINK